MVNDPAGATLWRLAATRVAGKPFTVTEYNHGSATNGAAECVPMIATYAALQDWDGVFLFAYSHNGEYEKNKIDSFFDIEGSPVKMGLMPLGSRIFLGGAITPLAEETTIYLPREKILRTAPAYYDHVYDLLRDEFHVIGESTLTKRLSITFDASRAPASSPARPAAAALSQAQWTGGGKVAGQFTAGTRGRGLRGIPAPETTVEITPVYRAAPRDVPFAALIAAAARPGETLATTKIILLAAVGHSANDGMKWDAGRHSVADQWGQGPARVEAPLFTLAGKELSTAMSSQDILAPYAEADRRARQEDTGRRIGVLADHHEQQGCNDVVGNPARIEYRAWAVSRALTSSRRFQPARATPQRLGHRHRPIRILIRLQDRDQNPRRSDDGVVERVRKHRLAALRHLVTQIAPPGLEVVEPRGGVRFAVARARAVLRRIAGAGRASMFPH